MNTLPILIIIPHGGMQLPVELEEIALTDRLELFLASDSCANELFNFSNDAQGVLTTHISKLFIDVNRAANAVPPRTSDGVIKNQTPYGKNIFEEPFFPDEIAAANIIKRYYLPFHETIDKIIKSGEIRLVIECHTSFGIGLPYTPQADKPLPLISIYNRIERDGKIIQTCHDTAAVMLLELLKKSLNASTFDIAQISESPSSGYLMQTYAKYIPYLRLDISRALFFDDRFFNLEYIKVDELRIKSLKKKIWEAIRKTYLKCI